MKISTEEAKNIIDAHNDFFREEELNPVLAEYVSEIDDTGLIALRHPLVYFVPYHEIHNHHANEMFRLKREKKSKAIDEKDWNTYVFIHERPYRLNALMEIAATEMPDTPEFTKLIRDVWEDSENIWQNKDLWEDLLGNLSNHRDLMNEEELAVYDSLPEELTVYRGVSEDGDRAGFSWTLDYDRAEWFARRLTTGDWEVLSRTINSTDVLAYLNGRGEEEIVIL